MGKDQGVDPSTRRAAEQGKADAQYELGRTYDRGLGVREDDSRAVEWYKKAAKQGHARAQYELGHMYQQGHGGLPQHDSKAAWWYRKAAEQGHARAQAVLGRKYASGDGVPTSRVRAHMWAQLAAAHGNELGSELRDELEPDMTKKEIAEAREMAVQWRKKHGGE